MRAIRRTVTIEIEAQGLKARAQQQRNQQVELPTGHRRSVYQDDRFTICRAFAEPMSPSVGQPKELTCIVCGCLIRMSRAQHASLMSERCTSIRHFAFARMSEMLTHTPTLK